MFEAICIGVMFVVIPSVIAYYLRTISNAGQSLERRQYSYQELSEDYDLWNKYVNDPEEFDPKTDLERGEFDELTVAAKIAILDSRFGKERRKQK